MRPPAHLVVVCHANVARSVAAAHLLAAAADERALVIEVRTAGTHASDGQPASARTRTALEEVLGHAVALGAHRSHQLDDEDVAWADLIVAMEASQVRFVRRAHPDGASRTATLAALAAGLPLGGRPLSQRVAAMDLAARDDSTADDVADPAGGDEAVYEATMRELVELCGQFMVRLAG